ncbi:MAG TPA: type III-B CRISPR module-associated Cmr3 family protein [Syntrophales bacterium]|nr:type III-B CRISPR module-associated Cmr3 family protein [Syntrophales bacterium]
MEWYSFLPQDTLFFRGAEPAVMGENHTASVIFPPPAHTIQGALRTAVLREHNLHPADYNQGNYAEDHPVISAIGRSGEESPFQVVGPFFRWGERLWVPCPYHWFTEKEVFEKTEGIAALNVTVAEPITTPLISCKSGCTIYWSRGREMVTLGGSWVPLDELHHSAITKIIAKRSSFFGEELHTGVALDVATTRRGVREHHLYSFAHARLKGDVTLAFAVTRPLPLATSGVLTLGAEQRFGEYRKLEPIALPQRESALFMTLSILPANAKTNDRCVATGHIVYYGGWDLHRRFHKPMKGYFPAGTVVDEQINENCIPL